MFSIKALFNFTITTKPEKEVEKTTTWMDDILSGQIESDRTGLVKGRKNLNHRESIDLDNFIDMVITRGEFISCSQYRATVKINNIQYQLWIANADCAFLSEVEEEGSVGYMFKNVVPSYKMRVAFSEWLDVKLNSKKGLVELKSKFDGYRWDIKTSWQYIVDHYIKLKENNHYAKWSIASYAQEILDIKKDSESVLSKEELDELLCKHMLALRNIANLAVKEVDEMLTKEEQDRLEIERQHKELQKKLILENSDLLMTKYGDYTKDFGLEK